MQLFKKCALVAALLGAVPLAATAGEAGTLYAQLGTNGLGLGYGLSVSQDFAVRGQYNAYKKTYTGSVSDFGSTAVVTADIDLSTFQMLADWYPGNSGFRLTGGVVINNNKITISATGATVGTATNQNASAEIKLSDSPSPYLGFGYSSRPKFAKGLGFIFDAGIMFQDPKVTLTASGASAADVEAQRVKVQDAVKDLKNMPVLAFGISYSF
jgi:hypothetical protein